MKLIVVLVLSLGFVACSTTPDQIESPIEPLEVPPALKKPRRSSKGIPGSAPRIQNIDYEGLSRSIGMDPPRENLGFLEKEFATCQAGYGYSASNDCRTNLFSVINFRILCRDSEGTVQVAINAEDLRPLSGRSVSWALNQNTGSLRLDNQGYGQIKITSEGSLKGERLKITSENDFLYLKAGTVHRIVTPRNWCN